MAEALLQTDILMTQSLGTVWTFVHHFEQKMKVQQMILVIITRLSPHLSGAPLTISSTPYFTGEDTNVSQSGADRLGKHCCLSRDDKTAKDKNTVLNVLNKQTSCSIFKVTVHEVSH